jgi:hypothetical protein
VVRRRPEDRNVARVFLQSAHSSDHRAPKPSKIATFAFPCGVVVVLRGPKQRGCRASDDVDRSGFKEHSILPKIPDRKLLTNICVRAKSTSASRPKEQGYRRRPGAAAARIPTETAAERKLRATMSPPGWPSHLRGRSPNRGGPGEAELAFGRSEDPSHTSETRCPRGSSHIRRGMRLAKSQVASRQAIAVGTPLATGIAARRAHRGQEGWSRLADLERGIQTSSRRRTRRISEEEEGAS